MAPKRPKDTDLRSTLIKQRNNAQVNIHRINEYITQEGELLSSESLDCRLEIVETYFQQALDYQQQLEEVDQYATVDRADLEDLYCNVKVRIRTLMKRHAASSQVKSVPEINTSKLPENLPKLKLPTFSGNYADFPNFIRLFRTLVHEEVRLSPIEKFNHLLSCVSGPALTTIKTLDVTQENYETALTLLESRYSNKFLICQEHIKELFHIKKVHKGSPEQLRFLVDTVTARYNALLSLLNHEELSNALIVHLVMSALDNDSQIKIEESIDSTKTLSWTDCSKILTHRCQMLESREVKPVVNDQQQSGKSNSKQFNKQSKAVAFTITNSCCSCCKQNDEHALWKCPKFLHFTPQQRFEHAKKSSLCINCLSPQHTVRNCKSSSCKHCKSMHHSLLHRNQSSTSTNSMVNNQQLNESNQQQQLHASNQQQQHPHNHQFPVLPSTSLPSGSWSAAAMVSSCYNDQKKQSVHDHTILATASVQLHDKFGNTYSARALLDSGSQLNFVTRNFAQKLKLDMIKSTTVIGGIGDSQTNVNYSTSAVVSSRISNFKSSLKFIVLPSITGLQPDREINIDDWGIPAHVNLADPKFNTPQKIDMLLGADIFFQLFDGNQIKLGSNRPVLLNTVFGWIVSGRCKVTGSSQTSLITTQVDPHQNMQLEAIVSQFWELEKLPDAPQKLTKEHTECENHFIEHVRRLHDGRFVVKLPFKAPPTVLGDSKTMAIRRFFSLERRLQSDLRLKEDYSDFLKQYEADGHMRQVQWPKDINGKYFLPHHCVLRPEKSSTKCRVVFDASAKSSNDVSLNEILMVGPVVQKDLFEILLRFRLNKFGLMADIKAMYRQIQVYTQDQDVQHIVWRDNNKQDLRLYKLTTVTYGTASAPYLATRCLIELAKNNLQTNSFAANIALNDFYVDDLITGASSIEELQRIKQEVSALLMQAQLYLRKWHSNHQEFLNCIPEDEREKPIKINNSDVVKALGIIWDSGADKFKFQYKADLNQQSTVTKRMVLSQLAKLFDPIGLINPVIVKVKVFLQELWIKNLKWDEPIPDNLAESWRKFSTELAQLNNLSVPRFVLKHKSSIQLHGFADASLRAYGCVFYIRCTDACGNTDVNLYTAKSKVSPINVVRSMPCLELCAAHMVVQLLEKIRNLVNVDEIILWSDSVIVLAWLVEHASSFNTFVANRISYIQEHTNSIQWKYVPSSNNPADIVSRGASVSELKTSIWYTGPKFLSTEPEKWPNAPKRLATSELPDRKIQKSILISTCQQTILTNIYRCSDFLANCRRIAYVRRFVLNCRPATRININARQLTPKEIDDAFLNIVAMIQHQSYATEIGQLKKKIELATCSTLKLLNPFLEEESGLVLVKVGGRLKNASLPYETKCPIILPKNNVFVQCYVQHLHIRNMHAGAQALVCLIRQRFWIIGAREYARKIVQKCVHCFKYKPKMLQQIMGNLPRDRVIPVKPFTHCGVDFCGPIITTWRIRGKPLYKSYIAVFICFVTRAIHMEVVSDLTTDAFLAALKRFVARRGLCTTLYLDNATNFVGARNKLKEFRDQFLNQHAKQEVINWCANNSIEFKHIPPRSPHFGGLWEAAVKSAKTLLYKTMHSATLTFEELATVITQIESILNSRPLTALPTDPSDEPVLTPAHFLNMTNTSSLIEPQLSFQKISLLSHWQKITAIQQHFWTRWSKEFLTSLQQRRKWDSSMPNVEPGTIVMIHEDNLPPQKWLIGRITQVFKGADDKVRVAEVKSSNGLLRRSIVKLAALPLNNDVI